ncbi:MAG: XTP/dITP diphosphatase [Acutalibacteraceae bacterium]
MDFLIATHNMKKRAELERILKPIGVRVLLAEEAGVELTDVEETGVTFEENAFLKADSGCKESGMPCIADDSGLAVDALDGAPGVYSARYAGEHGNDEKNNELLLKNLSDIPMDKRTARFVSTVCCCFPDGRHMTVRGECEGKIAFEPAGEGGFGYDPLFLPDEFPGKTMAQLTAEEKDSISHRGKALRLLAKKTGGNYMTSKRESRASRAGKFARAAFSGRQGRRQ